MPSTYTTNGGIEKIASGEQSGTWGDTTNLNFDIVDRITNGVGTINLSSSGAAHTLTTTDGTLSDGMYSVLLLTSASQACTITVAPNTAQKVYFVKNSSGYTCTFSQGSGANVAVANGATAILFCNGAGSGAVVTSIAEDLSGLLINSNNLSDVSNAGTSRSNLGLAIGSNVQAYDAGLQSISGLTTAANKMIYTSGSDTYVVADLTAFARTILDDADAASVVATLGITSTVAELNYNDITTLGTSQASKVVTADANGDVKFSNAVVEKVYALSGTALDPNNGTSQTKTLSANTTFSDSLVSGESMSLGLVNGSSYTVTFPTITWVSRGGNNAPTLTANDTLVFYKISSTLYGVYVGSSA